MDYQQYRLRWNNHRTNMLNVFGQLLTDGMYTDVTLAVDDGQTIKCHKIVLAACSSYFQELFRDHQPCEHMIVVLKDVGYFDIKSILQYMYSGEVNVCHSQLGSLLKVAEVLRVKGLVEEQSAPAEDDEREEESRPPVHEDHHHHHHHHPHSHRRPRQIYSEASMSPPPAISTSTGGGSASMVHSSGGHPSPPHSTGGAYDLYGKSSTTTAGVVDHGGQNHLAAPSSSLWLHPGITTSGHQPTSHSSPVFGGSGGGSGGGGGGGGSYDNGANAYNNGYELPCKRSRIPTQLLQPPGGILGMTRDTPILRTVLGQAHADSSQSTVRLSDNHEPLHYHGSSNGPGSDKDSHLSSVDLAHEMAPHSSFKDILYDEKKQLSPVQFVAESKVANNSRTPNWKRYKQYTREDILAAIDAVRMGTSAVQAARRYKVPSRTLYDKVKKLGIPTSRPFKRSANSKKVTFAPFGLPNVNGGLCGDNVAAPVGDNKGALLNLENVPRVPINVFEAYGNAIKEPPREHDPTLDPTAGCSSSPEVLRCADQPEQLEDEEDEEDDDEEEAAEEEENNQVEDLSVSRKSDVPVIVQPVITAPVAIKDEAPETESDNNDRCDN